MHCFNNTVNVLTIFVSKFLSDSGLISKKNINKSVIWKIDSTNHSQYICKLIISKLCEKSTIKFFLMVWYQTKHSCVASVHRREFTNNHNYIFLIWLVKKILNLLISKEVNIELLMCDKRLHNYKSLKCKLPSFYI